MSEDRLVIVQPGPLSLIALGIRTRLEQVFPARQFVHAWMPAHVDRDVWTHLTRRTPLVGIGFNGFDPQAASRGIGASTWSVYLVTRNEAGHHARLFGDKQAPGLFGVLEVGVAALHGHTIEDGGTIQVREAVNAFVEGFKDEGMALGTIDLHVPTVISMTDVIANGDAEPGLLNTRDITWSFDNGAGEITGSVTGTP